ncbi:MAG: MarC family protein [Verrucomicrobiales bacterium]|nr:MarC family protein [Verrucomicrobiales bacterium]
MTLLGYTLFAFSSLFVIIDPIATVPVFLAMTPSDSVEKRLRTARLACLLAGGVLLVFAFVGRWIFELLGLTIPAFQMAASIILLLIALDMLRAQRSRVKETHEETAAGAGKEDIAVTPLAVPLLAGPGAISTAILLHNKADTVPKLIVLALVIAVISGLSFVVFAIGARTAKWLGPIAMRLIERLMGLLLAAIAVQFFLNALRDLKVISFGGPG